MSLNKINPMKIICKHLDSLYDASLEENQGVEKTRDQSNISLFFIFPLLVSVILVLFTWNNNNFESNKQLMESLLISLTIFTPMMFSVLSIIYSMSQKKLTLKGFRKLKEFKYNVLFVILISLVALFSCIIFILNICNFWLYIVILKTIIFYLLGNIGLTILMIIKRFDYIMDQIINKEIKKRLE
ncbi:hypothetical protein MARBORIA2_02090 [Methanobrevibacter arboriphilus]|jgi:membrane-associated HD superfamily phosphohydrolase|uniref:hypothetical protein n=1 Tax=Methanobrevibacter arboriphilus TaxID=39441 RepID=UPI0022ED8385|nr:hypothetical protein [Methanobrevibacter arboriphilus]GLI11119.1 hypothetical protein MARBORIA2_02090 [Methanobrevibacter arboriphilus]